MIGGRPVEIAVSSLSPATVRITVLPLVDGAPAAVPDDGGAGAAGRGEARRCRTGGGDIQAGAGRQSVGALHRAAANLHVETRAGVPVQRLTFDAADA